MNVKPGTFFLLLGEGPGEGCDLCATTEGNMKIWGWEPRIFSFRLDEAAKIYRYCQESKPDQQNLPSRVEFFSFVYVRNVNLKNINEANTKKHKNLDDVIIKFVT